MRYYEHVFIAFVANALVFYALVQANLLHQTIFYSVPLLLAIVIAIALFSVLPDVDSINSEASKLLRLTLFAIAVVSLWEFFVGKSVLGLAKAFLALLVFAGHFLYARRGRVHRQFPHTFTFGVLTCIVAFVLTGSKTVAFAGGVAFVSHLAADWHLLSALKNDAGLWKSVFRLN